MSDLLERYTEKRPCVVEDYPDAHTVWLLVGNQQFCVNDFCETAEHADWMRKMLAKALERFEAERAQVAQAPSHVPRDPTGAMYEATEPVLRGNVILAESVWTLMYDAAPANALAAAGGTPAERDAVSRREATDPRLCPHGEWRAECLDCLDGGYAAEHTGGAMAQVCLDLHAALGVPWGGDPYARIAELQRDRDRLQALRDFMPVQMGDIERAFDGNYL